MTDIRALILIGTDCIGSCKSNYHTITTMTAQGQILKPFIFMFGILFALMKKILSLPWVNKKYSP